MKRPRSIVIKVAIWTVLAIVAVPTLAIAVWRLQHGQGAGVYTNVYGLAIHYTSALILIAALILTIGVAYIARIVHLRRYGEPSEIRDPTPYTDPGNYKE
jgi:ABC-type spermidine/putrescine transport system permease subunit II